MQNFDSDFFFSKPIKLINLSRDQEELADEDPDSDIDFQLFPEGGVFLHGQVNHVAFRAIDKNGLGVSLKGEVRDREGNPISEFETKHLGMGRFLITPELGNNYQAVVFYNDTEFTVPLPRVHEGGYLLNVRQNSKKTFVKVTSEPGRTFDNCYVVAHSRGAILTVVPAQPGKSFIYFALANDSIPAGISHFTFFRAGLPMLERLVFNENKIQEPKLVKQEQVQHSNRENAVFKLVFEGSKKIQKGSVSVSVQKSSLQKNLSTIKDYLLLTSDLKGTIEYPDSYFALPESERRQALDLLMMTHGWRRFNWDNVLASQYPAITFYPESGFSIEGQVLKYENRKKSKESNLLLTFVENMGVQLEAETEEDGTFWFDGLAIQDTMTVVIQTVDKEKMAKTKNGGKIKKDRGTYISIKDKESPDVFGKPTDPFLEKEEYRSYLDDVLEVKRIAAGFDERHIMLDAIEVEAEKEDLDLPFKRPSMLHNNPDTRLVMDSITNKNQYTNVFQLLQRVPGVVVSGISPNMTALIRGFNSIEGSNVPVYLLDGVPTDGDLLNNIDPRTIEFIDVLKGTRAIVYGTRNGVVALYTYKNGPNKPVPPDPVGFQTFTHFGFYPEREFYVPKYDIMSLEEKVRPDYRTTQYWNPKVEIEQSAASFSFYTSDDKGDFVVYLEGMTNDGRIIKDQMTYRVD